MRKHISRLITTHLTRDNIRLSLKALESLVKQTNNNEEPMPVFLNHDHTKQIGFVVKGTAQIVSMEDEEYAVEGEVNLFESEEEFQKYSTKKIPDKIVVLQQLNQIVVKSEDTNCPTYLLEKDLFSSLGVATDTNEDGLLRVAQPNHILQKGVLLQDEFILVYHPFFRRAFTKPNSFNKRLIDKIREIFEKNKELEVSFLTIPHAISLKKEYKDSHEWDYGWGPKLPRNLDDLQIGPTKHYTDPEKMPLENIKETDFWWHSHDNENMVMEIEELRDKSICFRKGDLKHFIVRYSHLLYSKSKKCVTHLDCSIRVYDEALYDDRLSKNDISKAGKSSGYLKLFRIDGELECKDAFDILSLYFYQNCDVREYLDGESA